VGKLTRGGLIEKREKRVTVKQYGNALLLHHAMKDLIPPLKAFDSWKEIYAFGVNQG